jgi:hypothetical protein
MIAEMWPAGSVPPNPVLRPGYRLDFAEAFNGPALDRRKWLPYHLPHWSSRRQAAARYRFAKGSVVLEIDDGQQPWCPEFDGTVRASSLQTGVYSGPVDSADGQARCNPDSRVREPQDRQRLYVPRYGYFEMRAKAAASRLNQVGLWLVGFGDRPERSGRICVCEISGGFAGTRSTRIGYGVHAAGDPALADAWFTDFVPIDATEFHIYAAEWTPRHVDVFVDDRLLRRIPQSPAYPMQVMLGIYERPDAPAGPLNRQPGYPKTFTIDYFRGYQPLDGYGRRSPRAAP